MKRKRRKQSIRWKIFIPAFIVILFQTFISTAALTAGGIFKHADDNAYTMLDETTTNRKNYLETVMLNQWSQLDRSMARINNIVNGFLTENGTQAAAIATDTRAANEILSLTMEDLISLLKRNYVSECFLILNTQSGAMPCTFLKSTAPNAAFAGEMADGTSISHFSENDLSMEYGLSSLATEYNISLSPQWQVQIPISESDAFFHVPIHTSGSLSSAGRSGYWSLRYRPNDRSNSLVYSIPLIAADQTVYGVLGVSVLEDRLLSCLPYGELGENGKGVYLLARECDYGSTAPQDSYEVFFHSGPNYERLPDAKDTVFLSEAVNAHTFCIQSQTADPVLANVQSLNLYSSGSPYFGEHWAVISLVEKSVLLGFSRQIRQIVMAAGLISLVIGILIIVFSSVRVTKPITGLARQLREADPQKTIRFRATGITEIDQLSHAVESLSTDLIKSASRLSTLIHTVNIGIGAFEYDKAEDTAFVSGGLFSLLHFDGEDRKQDRIMNGKKFSEIMSRLSCYHTGETSNIFCIPDSNGKPSYIRLTLSEEEAATIIGIVEDITAEINEKRKIEYERDYDILTGLLNRRAYQYRVSEKLHNRSSLKTGASLILDMDNLKYINDTYGHDFGDEYIKTTADVIRRIGSDSVITSRPSGDEFYLFFWGFDTKEEVLKLVERLWRGFAEHYILLPDGAKYRLRASGGLAWFPDDALLFDELLKFSDFAMYNVKRSSKGTWAEFDKDLYAKDSILLTGTAELNRIIENRQIHYCFQPIVDVKNASIYGYEALMRPDSDLLGSPLDVIRIARAEAKLYQIERLTLEKSLEEFDRLVSSGKIPSDRKIFINSIANYCLSEEDFERLKDRYAKYFGQLVIEILENDEIIEELFLEKRNTINKYNGQIALDDFGTGYNSEYALLSIEPELVKIDISIVRHIDRDVSRQNMLKGLLGFTGAQDIRVLAEGVETFEELQTLIRFGVDYIQGYYLGRPQLEPKELTAGQKAEILSCRES